MHFTSSGGTPLKGGSEWMNAAYIILLAYCKCPTKIIFLSHFKYWFSPSCSLDAVMFTV